MGEESGAIPGIIREPRGEIPTQLKGTGDSKSLEILKSIVYGGLMEFITSLSIVTSAAASGTTTCKLFGTRAHLLVSDVERYSWPQTTVPHCLLLTQFTFNCS